MSDRYFVDTNILVYAHDRTTDLKHERAKALIERLWDSGEGILSTQVLQELCINLRRRIKEPLPTAQVRQLIRDYSTWQIVVNTPDSILHSLELEARYVISFWDALILNAAIIGGASLVYSEDLAANQKYGPVQVVNPLLPQRL